MVQAAAHDLAHPLGDGDAPGLDLLRSLQAAVGNKQAHDLVDEEGVALGLPVDSLHQGLGRLNPGGDLDEAGHVALAEAAQEDALAELSAGQLAERVSEGMLASQLHVAVCSENHQAGAAQLPRQELQQEERRLVGPVEVVQDEDDGLAVARVLEERRDGVEQAEAGLLRLQGRRLGQAGQPLPHLRHHLGDVSRTRPHL